MLVGIDGNIAHSIFAVRSWLGRDSVAVTLAERYRMNQEQTPEAFTEDVWDAAQECYRVANALKAGTMDGGSIVAARVRRLGARLEAL